MDPDQFCSAITSAGLNLQFIPGHLVTAVAALAADALYVDSSFWQTNDKTSGRLFVITSTHLIEAEADAHPTDRDWSDQGDYPVSSTIKVRSLARVRQVEITYAAKGPDRTDICGLALHLDDDTISLPLGSPADAKAPGARLRALVEALVKVGCPSA